MQTKATLKTYFKEVNQSQKTIGEQEKRILAAKAKQGDEEAKNRLIEGHLNLVIHIASVFMRGKDTRNKKDYEYQDNYFLELIQEGNMMLCKVIKEEINKIDPEKNLTGYLGRKISGAMGKYIAEKSKLIRVPKTIVSDLKLYLKTSEELKARLEREPTVEEIAKERKWSIGRTKAKETLAKNIINKEKIVSLHMILAGELMLEGVLKDDFSFEEMMDKKFLKERVAKTLMKLNSRQREVILLKFGIKDDIERTDKEVGELLDITQTVVWEHKKLAFNNIKRLMPENSLALG